MQPAADDASGPLHRLRLPQGVAKHVLEMDLFRRSQPGLECRSGGQDLGDAGQLASHGVTRRVQQVARRCAGGEGVHEGQSREQPAHATAPPGPPRGAYDERHWSRRSACWLVRRRVQRPAFFLGKSTRKNFIFKNM